MLERDFFLPFNALALDGQLIFFCQIKVAGFTFLCIQFVNYRHADWALDRVRSVDCQHGFFFDRFQLHSLTDDYVQTQIAEVMLRIFALVLGTFFGHNGLRTLGQGLNQALDFVFGQVVIQAGMDTLPIRVRRIGNVYVEKFFLFAH